MLSSIGIRPHHFAISVYSLEETVKWYGEKLGFQLVKKFEVQELNTIGVWLKLGDIHIEIFETKNSAPLPEYSRHPANDLKVQGLKHLAFTMDDIEVFAKQLKSLGVEFFEEPVIVDDIKRAFIKDNNGMAIELIQEL